MHVKCALPESTPSVAVVGSVTIDRNVFADRAFLKIGGVSTYAGFTYRRHAVPTWVACNVAPAEAAILSTLAQEGIQVHNGWTPHTTRFVNRVHAGERTQETPSLAAPIRYGPIAAMLAKVDCIHLGPLHPGDIDPEVFARLETSEAIVALDVQGLVRRSDGGRIVPAASDRLPAALRAASIVKAEGAEMSVIREVCGAGIEALMERFAVAEWVVTSGSKGGRVHVRGGRPKSYEPVPVDQPVDPTGAGDVFFAAYTAARFLQRRTVAAASRHAARLSAEHIAGRYIPAERLDLSRRLPDPVSVEPQR